MPTYDYLCEECEHQLEVFQSITAAPKKKCPECGKLKLKRLIGTGAGIIFKGSGFYETDYRSENYKNAKKKESETSSSKAEKTDKKDSKSKDSTKKETASEQPKKTESKKKTA